METLKVIEQTGPNQSRTTPPKRYYVLTFADARKSNYFPKDNEIPNLKGIDVDVDLQANGQYWNIKSLVVHGAQAPSNPPSTESHSGSPSWFRLECLKIAGTVVSGEDNIMATAEKFFQFVNR